MISDCVIAVLVLVWPYMSVIFGTCVTIISLIVYITIFN